MLQEKWLMLSEHNIFIGTNLVVFLTILVTMNCDMTVIFSLEHL
jgi:hypothetical protein